MSASDGSSIDIEKANEIIAEHRRKREKLAARLDAAKLPNATRTHYELQLAQAELESARASLALAAEDGAGRDELERDLRDALIRCADECERAGNAIGRDNSPLVAGGLLDSAAAARVLLARLDAKP
jgi:hypothetical protein